KMSETNSIVAEQFDDAEQQHSVATLGMWTFLATEVLFFGGLFLAYAVYRHAYSDAFAVASQHTHIIFGTLNTAILLTSSLTMALAVAAAKEGNAKSISRWLLATIVFALGFLVVKGFEYHSEIGERLLPGANFSHELPEHAEIFFYLYWVMTGLHALHIIIGIGLLGVMTWLARRGKFSAAYHNPVEVSGLYWHFVDIVWIFLYPLLYLIGHHA
ncbi:MAG: cytochrome c oxidase subunit 3 family protein, partial [Verrucomicrobiota bacterium]